MSSIEMPAEMAAGFDAVDAALAAIRKFDINSLDVQARLYILRRLEAVPWDQALAAILNVGGRPSAQGSPSPLPDPVAPRSERRKDNPPSSTQPAVTDIAEITSQVATVAEMPLEQFVVEQFRVDRKLSGPADRGRREAALQKRYAEYLRSLGHRVIRKAITLPGQLGTLYTDLYDATTDDLIEVKSTSDRITIRLALGQILDYARYVKPRTCTILLPSAPSPDLIDLLKSFEVQTVWLTDGHGFEHSTAAETERRFDHEAP